VGSLVAVVLVLLLPTDIDDARTEKDESGKSKKNDGKKEKESAEGTW
jgi:hypothetical protein